jgi:hypothetical protein
MPDLTTEVARLQWYESLLELHTVIGRPKDLTNCLFPFVKAEAEIALLREHIAGAIPEVQHSLYPCVSSS